MERQVHQDYLAKKVNPIFEKMVIDILLHKPDNVLAFISKWIKEKGDKVMAELNPQKKSFVNAYGEESNSDEDEEAEEDIADLNYNKKLVEQNKAKKSRISVSAEAYGAYQKKSEFQPKIIKKSEDQINRIKDKLEKAFMFSALDENEKKIVIDSFVERKFKKDETVIKQGENGDDLYVVDSGELDCFKESKSGDKSYLKTYVSGEAFGELALLYNAPRAATIIAKNDCDLWALDRACFNHIVKNAASLKREKYENFLSKIDVLNDMDPYERSKIADALKKSKFHKNEFVVKEGEKGDSFFFVENGEAIATKVVTPGKPAEEVFKYYKGDYFGELALLRDTPRAANIVATTDLELVYLDRHSFKRLLGPLEDILKRNFGRYQRFIY